MRISSLTALLLPLTGLASAASIHFPNSDTFKISTNPGDGEKIPGESPLELCPGDHSQDQIIIENVDLSPNPPRPGTTLDIVASGIVKQAVEPGAYVIIQVKYGLIRLIKQTEDLCNAIGNVDLKCPLEAGKISISKTVELPSQIPPGHYTVIADVYNSDDTKITCLTASVNFPRPGLGGSLIPSFDL